MDVRESIGFFVEIAGMEEGSWQAPAQMGDFSIDPRELAILPLGEGNRGLHLIRPDAGFALRNGFAHNPSLGGHPAFWVPDILAVMARLEAAGWPYSDAGVYAMPGMHQVYCLDPSANMLEINQYV
jgi:catechol 2,3-dioxygenase-like lactoylglutathione lyase family enzyme